ncbi:MAG: ABC transporter permease [Prevotella sp.]|nr:ABC transporter permease [Prevotella sp.]
MVIFPIVVTLFFTSLMNEGQPVKMPVGVVDMDNTTTSRAMIRKLNSFQTTDVVANYANINEARNAIQRNKIYAFLYIPESTTDKLLASRQPKISFYYSSTSLTAGALLFRDLKTISTLGSASVGSATMAAKGYTSDQIRTFLQPIAVDLHTVSNPWISYNIYLSTMLIPGCLMIFMFLITAYSIGTELKFDRSKQWMRLAGNNPIIALAGKMLPQFIIFITIFYAYLFYIFGVLEFPHPGGVGYIMLLGLISVLASEGFGIFAFGLMPSLRMSMSICSLWAVLSFSMVGSAFPVASMDPELQALAYLFPLRHYFMIYQICIFNGYPLIDAWINVVALLAFALLPILILGRIKKAMLQYIYIP